MDKTNLNFSSFISRPAFVVLPHLVVRKKLSSAEGGGELALCAKY